MKSLHLRLVEGDLTEFRGDAIVNPANSYGVMGGGVAGAIRKKGGAEIEKEAVRKAPIPIGKAVATTAGRLPCKLVIHAPTMTQPAEAASLAHVKNATRAALECADTQGLKQLAFPGMGTGTGRMDPEAASQAMVEIARSFQPKSLQEVIFVAFGEELKQAFSKALQTSAPHA